MQSEETEVLLPLTEEGLDEFIRSIAQEFHLPPDHELVTDAICAAIMHLPRTQAKAERAYFGACAHKQLAQDIAYRRLEKLARARKDKDEAEKKQAEAKLTLVQDAPSADGQPLQNA